MNRRQFLETVAAAAVVPTLGRPGPANEWGTPVFDLHFHLRPQPASNLAHLDGAGITKANLLTRGDVARPGESAAGRSARTVHLVQQLRRDQTRRRAGAHAGREGREHRASAR